MNHWRGIAKIQRAQGEVGKHSAAAAAVKALSVNREQSAFQPTLWLRRRGEDA